MQLTPGASEAFLETLWQHYAVAGRTELPWRQPDPGGSFDPYRIMVSELMLQQTQVVRVIPKYEAFLRQFPNVPALATVELGDVLRAWQGLGYNRRAKFLWQAAQVVASAGVFPRTVPELVKLPGIGVNTAGAIMAYAYDEPVVFVETNVRTVYIHHFFRDRSDVSDAEIREALEQTLDREQPRQFYWALMDYGSYLKATVGNRNRDSKHYTRQSIFQGSRRQVRGAIIRLLGTGPATMQVMKHSIADERMPAVLDELLAEGMIHRSGDDYRL